MANANTPRPTMAFKPVASHPKDALALIYDLEGFSRFFNQPDVQDYVPRFLNHIYEAVSVTYMGGQSLCDNVAYVPLIPPRHENFLGDGMLLLWTFDSARPSVMEHNINVLCNRLWNLKHDFHAVLAAIADDVPVLDVPSRIRFGLARGTVYELSRVGSTQKEYFGFCINLASRLQSYCPGIGFMASARLRLKEDVIRKNGYRRVVATKIKGFPKEAVIVDENEFTRLPKVLKEEYFEEMPRAKDRRQG